MNRREPGLATAAAAALSAAACGTQEFEKGKDGGEWRVAAFHNTIVQPLGGRAAAPAAAAAPR